jgi:3-hydroxyisobutyrate dehydrogenase-like beta-hydroxyacid dehydrogenase
MARMTIGLLHPGEMGSALGALLSRRGVRVLWASAGRSAATRSRGATLEEVGTFRELIQASEFILSVCPPHAAADVARKVAEHGFSGTFADLNAVSPETVRAIGRLIEGAGGRFIDGGIVGPPPTTPGTTRLYLAGPEAGGLASLFQGSVLEVIVLDGPIGSASALKVAYAAYTKGTAALLLAIRALAIREGVDAALRQEWARSLPDLASRGDKALGGSIRKAWRFVGEMEENAATFVAAGLPSGFSAAAAEVYRRLGAYKDATALPPVAEIAAALAKERQGD